TTAQSCNRGSLAPPGRQTPRRSFVLNGALAASSRGSGLCAGVLEVWHHVLGEYAETVEYLLLWHGFDSVQQEVHAVDADRFPHLASMQYTLGVADSDPFGHACLVARARGLFAQSRQEADRRIRTGGIKFARG